MTARNARFSSRLEESTNRLWGAHLRIPPGVVRTLSGDGGRRVICRLNNVVEYQCAMLPIGDGVYVVSVNKSFRTKLDLDFGDTVDVELRKDESDYGLPFPGELKEVFRQDRRADRLFHALTPGRQRTLLHIVGTGRSPDLRTMRSIIIAEHLTANEGTINYRSLNAELRSRLSRTSRRT